VVQELKGEKIDIIPWHVDPAKFVCNALAPADISRVIIDETNHAMEVVVPDDALSIAIGRQGQNVRLASKLTGWQLDVKSETRYDESLQEGYASLLSLPDMTEALADLIVENGFFSAEDLAKATVEEIAAAGQISEEAAQSLINDAERIIAAPHAPEKPSDTAEE